MTDTESIGTALIDPALAEGRSRLSLFVAMGGFGFGTLLSEPLLVWGSVAVIVFAFALNTAGKLGHYRQLSIPTRDQFLLAVSWLLVALTVVGLLVNFTYARYGPGTGSYFWSLAAAGIGFGLLHMAAQSNYLPASEDTTDA